jgi:hypothetical protein
MKARTKGLRGYRREVMKVRTIGLRGYTREIRKNDGEDCTSTLGSRGFRREE